MAGTVVTGRGGSEVDVKLIWHQRTRGTIPSLASLASLGTKP